MHHAAWPVGSQFPQPRIEPVFPDMDAWSPNHWSAREIPILIKSSLFSEKAMAPHSSTLAWKIPWMEEPGRQQSMGSRRVGHDWATSLSLFTFMHWRRKWQPTPVFLSGESRGQGSMVGCCLWGRTESDTTEAMQQQQQQSSIRKKKNESPSPIQVAATCMH